MTGEGQLPVGAPEVIAVRVIREAEQPAGGLTRGGHLFPPIFHGKFRNRRDRLRPYSNFIKVMRGFPRRPSSPFPRGPPSRRTPSPDIGAYPVPTAAGSSAPKPRPRPSLPGSGRAPLSAGEILSPGRRPSARGAALPNSSFLPHASNQKIRTTPAKSRNAPKAFLQSDRSSSRSQIRANRREKSGAV